MTERRHIRLLPASVANKIAAGEVVERPASVVRELVENALDAGARRVEVSVVAGGRKLISVSDDGCGMERDDAIMSLEQQATSKIREAEDIERIESYGFRGEAIPSIASVSRLTIRTCAQGENVGTIIEVVGGEVQNFSEIGFPVGTTIEVRDLFFNIPARRKFLKTYNTEQAHIRTTFILQALAHPEIGMRMKADGRDIYNLAPGATLAERVVELLGADVMASLRPIDYADGRGTSIYGYVGTPTLTRADRGEQYIFVNKRAASAPVIPNALREAYPPLEGNRRPIVVLFVDLNPADVDVNVHPAKREVRFRDASAVRAAIVAAVSRALGVCKSQSDPPIEVVMPPPNIVSPVLGAHDQTFEWRYEDNSTSTNSPDNDYKPTAGLSGQLASVEESRSLLPAVDASPRVAADSASDVVCGTVGTSGDIDISDAGIWAWSRVLGQIADGYAIIETDGGYVVLDPRAAHERVLYERMLNSASATPVSQALLIPESVSLPPDDAARISSNIGVLRALGFGIDLFGHDGTFIIDAIPIGIEVSDYRTLLTDISHEISISSVRRGVDKWREKMVAQAASRAAVAHVGKLGVDALRALVRDLCATKMPYTCPRGRPTMLFTPLRELARKFGRE